MLNVKKPKRPVFRGEGATAMFEVQIMSDLHLEFPNALAHLPSFEPRAPYLLIVARADHTTHGWFIIQQICGVGAGHRPSEEGELLCIPDGASGSVRARVCRHRQPRILHLRPVPSVDTVHRQIREFCSTFDNLHFLHMSSVLLEDNGHKVRVLGTTLWHHCPEKDIGQVERTLNDYAMIGRKTVDVAMQHKSHQTVINGVMVASNQRGYFMAPPEKAGFSPEFVVTIDHDRQSYIMRNDPAKTNQQD
ncbi:uncharacterized protein ACA1_300360 [Acanthamoeba castellanii str. Neff]|uniref:Uncharacterized protein n=1 Tax=Acanthamoeba castellanii (strain ATCC 30010 / Neff) TaxID=1257118 RepID=L8GYS5_ACACF|nr:uncharacterized protein ACA1_300360 [Acanthamoeba castellanii str. Neff]ELR18439.1 hypothetical protein ACA1_300360 [Acanthamoeba castellanii str. Neff]